MISELERKQVMKLSKMQVETKIYAQISQHLHSGYRSRPMTNWKPISSAPKDGTIFDVWLGDTDGPFSPESTDIEFYCTKGTRRSPGWAWINRKFRPYSGLLGITVFVQSTHWMPLPAPPRPPHDQKCGAN